MRTLLLIALLSLTPVFAQEGFDKIKIGDHVVVTLRNSSNFIGHVIVPFRSTAPQLPGNAPFDYSKETALTLNLSLDDPTLGPDATISFSRKSIRVVRVLTPLSAEETRVAQEAMNREQARLRREDEERRAVQQAQAQELQAALQKRAAEEALAEAAGITTEALQQAAIDFYTKYPEPEWGAERFTAIQGKLASGVRLTAPEQEFMTGYATLWVKGREYTLGPQAAPPAPVAPETPPASEEEKTE